MKTFSKILSIFLVFTQLAQAGLPPTSVQGQADTSALPRFNFQVPNSQLTNLGGIKALFETGNLNLLANPSFEHTTYSTSWTITTATGAVETSTIATGAGKQSAKLTFSSQTGDISQSVTPVGNTLGVNMEASCSVNTTMTTIQVCSLTGGTEGSCVAAPSTGNWNRVIVNFPGPANGTTVGVKVKTSSSATGSFYSDDCYAGTARNISSAPNVSDWVSTRTFTINSFGTVTNQSIWSRQVGDSLQVMGSFTPGTPTAATASITVPVTIDSTKVSSAIPTLLGPFFYAAGSAQMLFGNSNGGAVFYDGSDTAKVYLTDQSNVTLSKRNASSFAASGNQVTFNFTIPVTGWTANNVVNPSQPQQPTITKELSGSGTYTTPAGVSRLEIYMAGGGGGGSGAALQSSGNAGNGGTGGNTTFGSSLLTANGGAGGSAGSTGGTGGTATVAAPAIGLPLTGAQGTGAPLGTTTAALVFAGSPGASTPFGGGGGGGAQSNQVGYAAPTNTGAGGGGASCPSSASGCNGGSGGGAGGWLHAIITGPSATYSYAVGAAGSAGSAGTGGSAGGAGGSGVIFIVEYYNSMNAPILVGGLTTASSGATSHHYATFTNNGTVCAAAVQDGAWLTFSSRPGTGDCIFNITAGSFGSAVVPTCQCTPTTTGRTCGFNSLSSSQIEPYSTNASSGAANDITGNITCDGAK